MRVMCATWIQGKDPDGVSYICGGLHHVLPPSWKYCSPDASSMQLENPDSIKFRAKMSMHAITIDNGLCV